VITIVGTVGVHSYVHVNVWTLSEVGQSCSIVWKKFKLLL